MQPETVPVSHSLLCTQGNSLAKPSGA